MTIIRARMANSQMISVAQMLGAVGQRQREKRDQRHAGHAVGFKAVRRRADGVAGVVAGAIGDDAGILRIIFRQLENDFHQVGADVGDLGENAAADAQHATRRAIRRWQSR